MSCCRPVAALDLVRHDLTPGLLQQVLEQLLRFQTELLRGVRLTHLGALFVMDRCGRVPPAWGAMQRPTSAPGATRSQQPPVLLLLQGA